jgi:hypothetical protein
LIQKNLCADFDIRKHINQLNISDNSKNSLLYWIEQREQGQACDDFILGMCLALQNEGKINPEDFITITMHTPEKRKEESRWKSFLKIIRFWER